MLFESELGFAVNVYIINSRATTKKVLKSITDTLRREKWKNIKCLINITIRRKKSERQKQEENKGNKQKMVMHMLDINLSIGISIITLKSKVLIKIQRLLEWIKKQEPSICWLQKSTLHIKTHRH